MSLWDEAEVNKIMEVFYNQSDKKQIKELVKKIEQMRSNR